MGLGVVDDIAVLAETDIRNKESIVKRKSKYAQLSGQIENMEKTIQDKEGTIETLERQLVQAGIKNKIMRGTVEVDKKKHEVKSTMHKEELETKAMQKHLRKVMDVETTAAKNSLNKS